MALQTTDQQQAPQPDDQDSVTVGRFDGLKNTVDREDLGPRDLALAVNVDLDDVGKAHRRRGRTLVASGNFHSLWPRSLGGAYGVKNAQLGIINPDYSFRGLGVVVGGDFDVGWTNVAYAQVKDQVYFSCPTASGIIDQSSNEQIGPWGPPQDFWLSPVLIPSPTLPQIAGRLLGAMPYATFLAYYNGRLYGATGNVVWYTDLYTYNLLDKTKNYYQFEGQVTMLGAVADGIYVGTDEGCYFLGGDLAPLKKVRVIDSPVIPGSMVLVPSELANPPQVGLDAVTPMQVSLAFMTTRGFCVAEDGGHAVNLTERNFFFPVSQRASAFFRRQDGMNHYIVCADSEGDPINGARFGEYVDAEIIRGKDHWITVDDKLATYDGAQ